MKIIGVIPARYASSRFPGKPLADICGKPMIWWTYMNVIKVNEFDEIYVATDSDKIANVCKQYGFPYLMTSPDCETCTDRVAEAAQQVDADIYVSVLGDEPCIYPEDISSVIQLAISNANKEKDIFAVTICLPIKNPIDAINTTTQKFALNNHNDVIFISRQPIPYPQQSIGYEIYKHIGVYCFTKYALDFFSETSMGKIETIEGNDLMRFIENRKQVLAHITSNVSLSVDTPKDLEKVKSILKYQIENGSIKI